jgi:hypothetical protein
MSKISLFCHLIPGAEAREVEGEVSSRNWFGDTLDCGVRRRRQQPTHSQHQRDQHIRT